MTLAVRKIVRHVEETRMESGRALPRVHRVAIVAAVFDNPYPPGYVEDLVTLANEVGEELGTLVGPPCVDLLGEEVEAYGKAALVGIDGELEHGSALIHNLRFGDPFRRACGGTELLPAGEKTGLTGAPLDVPLKHKLNAKTRSHHQTVTLVVPDAPRPREIVVACLAANAGRPLARLAPFGSETAAA
ncbi:amino acid synthesis family protein [Streptomyces sp. MP131-18]|uniref:amino acid synthesis family protein n=1 Tax=Streptomyces sp. MP131-18 TaxID=1857892 RepID=UPI00097BCD5A|nr:amino acid synthesis family protein [Streptomyces sp. MP131-18]